MGDHFPTRFPSIPLPRAEHKPIGGNSTEGNIGGLTGTFDASVALVLTVGQDVKAGVIGSSHAAGGHGVVGTCTAPDGVGVYGRGKALAGKFEGNVEVTGTGSLGADLDVKGTGRFGGDLEVKGDIRLVNADVAEDFDVETGVDVEAGSVVVFSAGGALTPCAAAYDSRVAGIVSGAHSFRPAIVLDR